MKPSEIVGNILEVFHRKSKVKKEEDGQVVPSEEETSTKGMDTDIPEGNKSMLKGDHGRIFGLSKPVVQGIIIFFVIVFGLAFFYAASDDSEDQKPAKSGSTSDIADSVRAQGGSTGGLSDDYGTLARANAIRSQTPGGRDMQTQNPDGMPKGLQQTDGMPMEQTLDGVRAVPAQPPTVAGVPPRSVVVPAQPGGAAYSQNYALPQQNPEEAQRAEAERSAAERLKERLQSAIAFAGFGDKGSGGSTPQQSGDASAQMADGSAGTTQTPTVYRGSASPTYQEPSDHTVTAGTLIPAMLLTGINTDAPGPVIAQIMADVYDVNGMSLIIPAGSRVLGKIGGAEGSKSGATGRIGISFDTIVLPNGGAWNIGQSMMAVDGIGYSGVRGKLHRHTGSNFMKGIMNSAFTALSTLAVDRVTLDASAFSSLTEAQQPTTTVAPGYTFNIYVTQNITF